MSRTMPSTLRTRPGIDEGVEADLGVRVLQLLVDLRDLDLLRPDVVDDLDALPLLHVVGDDLADRPVGELVVADVDPEVVEEIGVPQAVEVVLDGLLARVVVGDPLVLRRGAELLLDVIQVGLRLDDRRRFPAPRSTGAMKRTTGAEPAGGWARGAICWPQTLAGGRAAAGCSWAAARRGGAQRQGRHGKRTQRNTHFGYFRLRISGPVVAVRPVSGPLPRVRRPGGSDSWPASR